MEQKEMDMAVGKVLAAKEELRNTQKTARRVLYSVINEMGEVAFKPSEFWARNIGSDPKSLHAALAEDGVLPIQYMDDKASPREGLVSAIRKDGTGLLIDLVDLHTYEKKTIKDEDTWDADILLDFCAQFM